MLETKPKNTTQQVRVTVNNLIKLDPENPIPIQYGSDVFYSVTSKQYIPFLGKKDNLPNLQLEAYLTSPTHAACINTISDAVVGNGLTVKDKETIDSGLTTWMKKVNQKRQSFKKLLALVVKGERMQGNQFIEVVRGEIAGKKYLKIHLHSMLHCRLADIPEGSDDDLPKSVLISKEFAKRGSRTDRPKDSKEIPIWYDEEVGKNGFWKKRDDGAESTMIHYKNEVPGVDHYGLPESCASIRNQVMEGNAAQYNIDNFENNMILGGMLIFKSSMTQQEAQKQAKEIMMSHIGKGKTGRIAVVSSEEGIESVEFKPYETQKDGSWIELDKRNEEKIISAHNWDSTLAGINRSSSLGNGSSYIRAIYDVKETTLLKPLRTEVIENVVKPIMKIYAEWFDAKEVAEYEWEFISAMPWSFVADIKPEQFMKVNEARDVAGLPKDDSIGETYLVQMSKNNNKDVPGESASKEGADND
ncbi:MAG: phage portal protein [Agriterribacter sp.]